MTQRRPASNELCDGQTVRERLNEVALERDLRPSTRGAYLRAMIQLGIADELVAAVTPERVIEAAWQLGNVNTRRNALVAVRSVLGFQLRIPRGVPRRYNLPTEADLRLALLTSPYELRGLLSMYTGLRLGESCAVTRDSIQGRHLRIDRQVQALRVPGQPTEVRLVMQTKGAEADVWCPEWLLERVAGVREWDRPDPVRESLRRAFARVGIEGMTVHGLRHFFATTALDRGAPVALVSRALRHSDIATTLRTYHDTKIDAMEAFWS